MRYLWPIIMSGLPVSLHRNLNSSLRRMSRLRCVIVTPWRHRQLPGMNWSSFDLSFRRNDVNAVPYSYRTRVVSSRSSWRTGSICGSQPPCTEVWLTPPHCSGRMGLVLLFG